jgi:hypothetical protein
MTLEPITSLLIGIYGDIKTAKTSFDLSLPKPMVNFDFDQSFDRAISRRLELEPNLRIKKVGPKEKIDPLWYMQYDS